MMRLRSLSVAVALAETGSATRAAERLEISQPTVSYHVDKLEEALGVTLFTRNQAGLAPTDRGEVLVARARTILAEVDRLTRDVGSASTDFHGTIRISSSCFTNYHWLPRVLGRLRDRHGEVRMELDVDPSRRPFEALESGALDVALTTVPPKAGAFHCTRLFDDEIVAVVHPSHPLVGREHLSPADFADQAVVVFDRSQSDLFTLALRPAGVVPHEVTDIPVTDAILELVRANVAISAMATWVAEPALAAGDVRAIRIGPSGLQRTWWAVTSDRRPPTHPVTSFLEILREECRESRGAWVEDSPPGGRDRSRSPDR